MNIKLNARLSAYSKIDVPIVLPSTEKHEYVTEEQIDSLFDQELTSTVTKADIDSLFEDLVEPIPVSKETIDTLFDEQGNTMPVSKENIDSLFEDVGVSHATVSKKEIDSLFD